ncbi:Hypothetical predicted protein [Mytilus galloprovincialis]|uniref:Uncharacterized protein n=1 Tax=Mytilus galloprovincialis TaxID=29158 RepID=A0A8B6G589_MYTGA|nr:Hypothetical predicted protein [Mytilus galloprovincialis]
MQYFGFILFVLLSVISVGEGHFWGRSRRTHRWRPGTKDMEGSCTFDLPCDVETESFKAKIHIRGFVKSAEVAGPFSVTRHGFFKHGFYIRNNENLLQGSNKVDFTARYWGWLKPRYRCSLICYSCITTPPPPPPTPTTTPAPTNNNNYASANNNNYTSANNNNYASANNNNYASANTTTHTKYLNKRNTTSCQY